MHWAILLISKFMNWLFVFFAVYLICCLLLYVNFTDYGSCQLARQWVQGRCQRSCYNIAALKHYSFHLGLLRFWTFRRGACYSRVERGKFPYMLHLSWEYPNFLFFIKLDFTPVNICDCDWFFWRTTKLRIVFWSFLDIPTV